MFKNLIKNQQGFTLHELLIAIAIVSIMSAVVIAQSGNYQDIKALGLGEKQLINDIKIVQGKTYNLNSAGGSFPAGGYGIRFTKDSDQYIFFADDGDGIYEAGEESETVKLPRNVKVTDLQEDGFSGNFADLVFQPPYGKVLINGSEMSAPNVYIKLEIEINNGISVKTITVHSSRLIESL